MAHPSRRLTRRQVLAGGIGALLAGDIVGAVVDRGSASGPARPEMISPFGPQVLAAERRRHKTGRVVTASLLPGLGQLDLAGRMAPTWLYNHQVPGPELRCRPGDQLRVHVANGLPQPTSVHWHGIALRCDMDGVPGMTEPPLNPAGQFTYHFTVPDAGTYWYHPHVGVQRDRGLYGPIIVEDPDDPVDVDLDVTVMIDDWLDGTPAPTGPLGALETPDDVLARLEAGKTGGSTVEAMDAASPWGPMLGSVVYPDHLINGRPPADPQVITGRPGQRIRLRLINAGADTDYRVAIGGQPMTVVAADGYPVIPFEVAGLLIGKAERYDVVVTMPDGATPVVAAAEGKSGLARALLRGAPGAAPPVTYRPSGLTGPLLTYDQLRPRPGTELPRRTPDRLVTMALGRDATVPWRWTIDGRTFPDTPPVTIHEGERIRVRFLNETDMAHPMHTHGHTFALTGPLGTRKDTVVVLPGKSMEIDIEGSNPGQWMFHCHDEYHLAGGMATTLSYLT